MKKKETDLWLIKKRESEKSKESTKCIVVPSSSTHDSNIDFDSKEHDDKVEKNPILNTSLSCQQNSSCSSQKFSQSSFSETNKTNYARNSSTTRSWPVIHRNISQITPQQVNSSFLESNISSSNTKTEHLQLKAEQQKRKSTHQYDFDQIFGIKMNYWLSRDIVGSAWLFFPSQMWFNDEIIYEF